MNAPRNVTEQDVEILCEKLPKLDWYVPQDARAFLLAVLEYFDNKAVEEHFLNLLHTGDFERTSRRLYSKRDLEYVQDYDMILLISPQDAAKAGEGMLSLICVGEGVFLDEVGGCFDAETIASWRQEGVQIQHYAHVFDL